MTLTCKTVKKFGDDLPINCEEVCGNTVAALKNKQHMVNVK
jgi:hypothetical protein